MMLPWPAMSRGTEATVPRPPGLVSDIVAPAKSSGISLLMRAFSTRPSYAARNAAKSIASARLMTGTTRPAAAVLPRARPPRARDRCPAGVTRYRLPVLLTEGMCP